MFFRIPARFARGFYNQPSLKLHSVAPLRFRSDSVITSQRNKLMSRTNRNFVVIYALFVALPLLGLGGVLKAGRKLTAPVSVDGVWNVQADARGLQSSPCSETLDALANQNLLISQSGTNFTLALAPAGKTAAITSGTTGSGTIEGNTLRASLKSVPPTAGGCATTELSLVAALDSTSVPKSLAGSWTINGSALAFRARLQPAASSGGR